MVQYTNNQRVPVGVAVWLATDTYDRSEAGLSVTSLMKPIRQVILARRVPEGMGVPDVMGMVASRRGTAIHDAIERAWQDPVAALRALGYPERLCKAVRVNPDPATLQPGDVPVYLELRSFKDVLGVRVSGKFDFVIEGKVEDFKTTSTYSITSGNKDEDYILQGSLYRWLNPEIVTSDLMAINFIFSDWAKMRAQQDPNYPQAPIVSKQYKLLSVQQAEQFATEKVRLLLQHADTPEQDLPLCSDKDLWRSDPQIKYYKNPANRTRSTKNFDNRADADKRLYEDGNVGIVVVVPGLVRACGYCPAFTVCTQKDRLIASGDLVI